MFTDVKQQQIYKVKQRFEQGRVSGDPLMTVLSQAPYPHSNFSQLSRQNQTFFDIFSLNTQGKLSLYDPRELRLRRLESPLYPPPLSRPNDV